MFRKGVSDEGCCSFLPRDESVGERIVVRIRLKRLGRRHRPFFRICVMDARAPRDGKTIEELGTYDPMVPDTDARVVLNRERVAYWLSVGAQPSEKVRVLLKKYGPNGTRVKENEEALKRLQMQRQRRRAMATASTAEQSSEPTMQE